MVTDDLPCPVCQNTLAHYPDCPMKRGRSAHEHLEPAPGAVLMFQGLSITERDGYMVAEIAWDGKTGQIALRLAEEQEGKE